jgi:hypothetical protein
MTPNVKTMLDELHWWASALMLACAAAMCLHFLSAA